MTKLTAFSDTLKRHGLHRGDLPPSLFHYTTAGGFAGIVQSRNIRATNFSFMNDPSEVDHGRRLILDHIKEKLAARPHPRVAAIYRGALEELKNEAASEIYVSCFTTEEDNLSQWRAYGAGTARYALEFDPYDIYTATVKPHPYKVRFSRVEYRDDKQRDAINGVLDAAAAATATLGLNDGDVAEATAILARRLARMLPTLKNSAYEDEAEWRIILHVPGGETEKVKFDTSRGVIRSYIDFPLTARQLPLRSVYVLAPSRPKAAEKAANLVLSKAGIAAPVRYSKIPMADV